MRIAIGQLWQETNTLNPAPTTRADFEAFGVVRGPELVERMPETNELGGFIQSLRAWPEELAGLSFSHCSSPECTTFLRSILQKASTPRQNCQLELEKASQVVRTSNLRHSINLRRWFPRRSAADRYRFCILMD